MREPSRFCAFAAHDPRPHLHHLPEAESFAEAAIMFTEIWRPEPEPDGDVSVVVIDEHTGEEQCFRIDLSSGDPRPCA